MTAVPPRPAAPEAWRYPCYCLPGAARCDDPTACDRPAAPDATAGDGLQEAIAAWFAGRHLPVTRTDREYADAVLALPALRDVLAAAARDAEKVRRVEAVADEFSAGPDVQGQLYDGAYVADVFRAALDPS